MVDDPLSTDLEDLRRRTSIKWRTYPRDVLPLWVAEMDATPCEPVVRAVCDAMSEGDTGYPQLETYADALRGFAADLWGWTFGPEQVGVVPDVMQGIVEVLHLLTVPGDRVVLNSPVYTPFYEFLEHAGRQVVEAPLGADYRIDLDVLDRALDGAAALLLCNPHNPTGTVHTGSELAAVTELAAAHGARVVADEIHAPLVPPGQDFVPYLTVPGTERAFSLMSASKAWNLAGLKAALAVAGPDSVADLARMPEVVGHGASHLGVIAHGTAYREGGKWLEIVLDGIDRNRHLLAGLLAEHLPDVRYRPPEGTYLAWLDFRPLGLGDDPAASMLEHGRVALSSGPAFGTGGAGFARLNLATSPEILTKAVRRMAAAV